ncbi:MAG: protease modulator HflC [Oceanibaculum nanhaiense]|uniref:protease modulator HflC n=1 Tax=Oceanibaculum nanhaiense TaxID=1909734 RepID=UPI0025A33FA8|nr:protease modulator HflC [Oceanibaculum nanhaiense]MDM7948024.1 protease modulator HflC [Oceanibaculum nanhaiense]
MPRKLLAILGGLIVVAGIVASSALFTVHQTEQVLVLQFGEPKRVVSEPGLHVKLPFIQNLQRYELRVLDLDPPRQQVILVDQKRLDVDSYARFRITDPLLFYQSVGNEFGARQRLTAIINSALRRSLGNATLADILSVKREAIIDEMTIEVNKSVERLGLEIVDVRVRRADYPEQTSQAIYNRMRSEREREAKEARAEGFELGQQIRADAERQRVVIVANAAREAQVTRGEGDAEAINIYSQAFGQDPQFFSFYRSMEAYRESLGQDGTTMVLSPNSDFMRYFNNMNGAVVTSPR